MKDNFKEITKGTQIAERYEDKIIENMSKKTFESIFRHFPGKLYIAENGILFEETEEKFIDIEFDDVIDRACEVCFEKTSNLKEEIINNIDNYNIEAVTKSFNSYITLRNDMTMLDSAFQATKYAEKCNEMVMEITEQMQGISCR